MKKGREIKLIVIHCTATNPKAKTQAILDGWRKLGWKSNGYHKLINFYGLSSRLMDDELIGNGVRGHNSNAIHISYIGGIDEKGKPKDTRSEEQKEMLVFEIQKYLKKYPNAKVVGHRDLSPDLNKDGIIEPKEWIKVCPCFDATKEYADLKLFEP
jgi:N-acetylmuramoyl-L-alanine amidase